ncbi:hypothetical protein DFJ73DRAFT_772922 [Zopfochytrium polystomum]|nr:hypothetical protein DFJ73DRAFT_772922 [Zopfochytrium polystomum]
MTTSSLFDNTAKLDEYTGLPCCTAAMIASRHGWTEDLRLIIKVSSDLPLSDEWGYTFLDYAVLGSRQDQVLSLVEEYEMVWIQEESKIKYLIRQFIVTELKDLESAPESRAVSYQDVLASDRSGRNEKHRFPQLVEYDLPKRSLLQVDREVRNPTKGQMASKVVNGWNIRFLEMMAKPHELIDYGATPLA